MTGRRIYKKGRRSKTLSCLLWRAGLPAHGSPLWQVIRERLQPPVPDFSGAPSQPGQVRAFPSRACKVGCLPIGRAGPAPTRANSPGVFSLIGVIAPKVRRWYKGLHASSTLALSQHPYRVHAHVSYRHSRRPISGVAGTSHHGVSCGFRRTRLPLLASDCQPLPAVRPSKKNQKSTAQPSMHEGPVLTANTYVLPIQALPFWF